MTHPQAAEMPPVSADQLVRDYYEHVWHFAYSLLDDRDDADDAAQEALIATLSSLASYRGEAAFKTWLYSITLNVCRRHFRKTRSNKTLSIALRTAEITGDPEHAPEEIVARREADRRLWAAVDRLEEDQRVVIVLRYGHELSVKDIAFIMKTGQAAIHTRLHRARRNLQRLLGDQRN